MPYQSEAGESGRRVRLTPSKEDRKTLESEKVTERTTLRENRARKERNRATTCLLEKARQVKPIALGQSGPNSATA